MKVEVHEYIDNFLLGITFNFLGTLIPVDDFPSMSSRKIA